MMIATIKGRLRALLEACSESLSEQDTYRFQTFLDHDEWGLVVDELLAMLDQGELAIEPDVKDDLQDMAKDMGIL